MDQEIAKLKKELAAVQTEAVMLAYGYDPGVPAAAEKWQGLEARVMAQQILEKDRFRQMDRHVWEQADKERRSDAREDRATARRDEPDLDR